VGGGSALRARGGARYHSTLVTTRRAAAVLAILAAACGGCDRAPPGGGGAPADTRDWLPAGTPIVLVSIDTLRADHLPAYGYRQVATPAIDALRRDGVLFARAYAPVPLTFPSHASLLTGLLPGEHGVRDNTGYTLDAKGLPYLPRQLRAAGYATGAAVSALVLARGTGLAEGFDVYEDSFTWQAGTLLGQVQRPGGETLAAVRPWLRARGTGPFFLFLHLYEPHSPYAPPEPYASRYPRPYDGEIAAADAIVGELVAELRAIGAYDRALVLLLSDHGEGLGDHGEQEHGILLYREALQVPLVLKLPGARAAGATVETPVQLLDVPPTLLPLARATADPRQHGVSLVARIAGDTTVRAVYSETLYPRIHFGWSELTSVVDGPWHFIQGPDPELYDLVADPAEGDNRREATRPVVRRMQELLRAHPGDFRPPAAPSPEQLRQLAALGYVGSSAPPAAASGPLPDPKKEILTLEPLTRGFQAFARKDYATAIPALREITARHPRLAEAWEYLGQALAASGEREAAIAAYRDGLAHVGTSPNLAAGAARALLDAQRPADALRLLDLQLERAPDAPMLLGLRVRALLVLDRPREAVGTAGRLVALVPDSADAHYQLGIASLMDGDRGSAERELRRVLELAPRHVRAMNDLAVLLRDEKRLAEAAELLRRALAIDPTQEVARRNLATLEPR